jgi:hypothetical protein
MEQLKLDIEINYVYNCTLSHSLDEFPSVIDVILTVQYALNLFGQNKEM